MAPVTRSTGRAIGGGRSAKEVAATRTIGRGKMVGRSAEETTTVAAATTRGGGGRGAATRTRGGGGRGRTEISYNPPVQTHAPPDDEDDDDVYYRPPRPSTSYPHRNNVLAMCNEFKAEAISNTKLETLEAFLMEKAGLTYRDAIAQIIGGTLEPALKKQIIKEIADFVASQLAFTFVAFCNLVCNVEKWDNDVVSMVSELANNLKNTGLTILLIDDLLALGSSILESPPPGESSRQKLREDMQECAKNAMVNFMWADERMKCWVKSPTPFLPTKTLEMVLKSKFGDPKRNYVISKIYEAYGMLNDS